MLKVLYVDDEIINLNLFEISFRRDFSVIKSSSPVSAIDLYKENNIDVVITDLRMPGMDGIEFIKKIKEINPEQKCILLTAYYEPSLVRNDEVKALIYKYVIKPFKKVDLLKIIQGAVA